MTIGDPSKKNDWHGFHRWMANGFVCIVYMGHQSYVYERVEDIVPEMARLPIVADNGLAIGVVSNTRHPAGEDWVGMPGPDHWKRPSDLLRENSMLDHVTIGVSPVRRA